MNLLIYKTDIDNQQKVERLAVVFDKSRTIKEWSVDMEDIDNVLRIELDQNTQENEILHLVSASGIHLESLPD